MNIDNDPQIPSSDEMAKFRRDDLEFRAVTTFLCKLGSRDDRKQEKIVLPPSITKYMKQLASVSAMLVMNHEVIAIMPKRSATGITLFIIGPQSGPATETEDHDHDDDDERTPLHFITKDPSDLDHEPTNSVKLMDIPVIEIGTDIFEYIAKNWNQSFEQHAQATAQLIAACYSGGRPEWLRLAHYAIFQSASKVERRFTTTRSFQVLNTLPPPSEVPVDFPGFSPMDKHCVRSMLVVGEIDGRFPLLCAFVDQDRPFPNPAGSLTLLVEFHSFFLWLLQESKRKVEALRSLRKCISPPPSTTLMAEVELTGEIFQDLHHFVWRSELFGWYILKCQRLSISDLYASDDDESNDEAESVASECTDQDEKYEREGGDFPTEFETAGGDADPATAEQDGPADEIYSWLRLITSTVQHAIRFRRTKPGPRVQLDFQVINYPKSDKIMKPWQEIIAELGGSKDRQIEILKVLSTHPKFSTAVNRNRAMKFTGRAHCEAVLGSLHSLAKRGENLTWAGVPQEVMDLLKTSYSIVAPSKRCCPVCATLITSLSREHGAPILNTLTKHPFIFPTALPVGLPESTRRHLLDQYRERLRAELNTLVVTAWNSSGVSLQSEPLSVGSDDESMAQEQEWRFEGSCVVWLTKWFLVAEPDRREKWRSLLAEEPEMWECCRRLMFSREGSIYRGLKVPEYVFVDNVEKKEGEGVS